jgi:hypothetical protein
VSAPTPRGADPLALEAEVARVPLERALERLADLAALAAPAKLAWSGPDEAVLLVTLPRALDEADALERASRASASARAWLHGAGATEPPGRANRLLEEALCELAWSFEPLDAGALRVAVPFGDSTVRLRAEGFADGWIRASLDALLALGEADVPTLQRFALEENRRLRFARVSLGAAGRSRARVVWDCVLPARADARDALVESASAVLCARSDTWPGLRALRHAPVAQAFRRLRGSKV